MPEVSWFFKCCVKEKTMQTKNIVVMVTAKDEKEARGIARVLLEKKLAACVNVIKGVQSFFWWEGKVDQAQEILLVIKTCQKSLSQLIENVKAVHSYDVPEIIALPIVGGSEDYLNWVNETCS